MSTDNEGWSYKEFIKLTITKEFLKQKLPYNNLFIFDCQSQNRKAIFDGILDASSWKPQQDEDPTVKQAFDYIYVTERDFTPKKLFTFIKKNKNKTLIFCDDEILKSQDLLNIVQNAVCKNPETGEKFVIKYQNEIDFIFQGNIIFLTEMTMYKFKRQKKYFYVCRDVMKL